MTAGPPPSPIYSALGLQVGLVFGFGAALSLGWAAIVFVPLGFVIGHITEKFLD